MSAAGNGGDALRAVDGRVRHRSVPWRAFGDKLIVARPSDGGPVVLAATAAFVWRHLDDWTTPGELDQRLADVYPVVSGRDREEATAAILVALMDDDLLERA